MACSFPYLAGTSFSQEFLKAHTGWADLHLLFEHPPVSTQQIMHPDFYLKGVGPAKVTLPKWKGVVPADWKLLEENVMGEFGLEEVLKQFLDPARAAHLSPSWDGDRYALFEDAKTKDTRLVFLLALETTEDAARFFGQYSEALEMKYSDAHAAVSPAEFLPVSDPDGRRLPALRGICSASRSKARHARPMTRSTAPSAGRPLRVQSEAPGSSVAQIPSATVVAAR